ncbi:hypothetical protein AVEN_271425-1 [Araneus ventricosus]|uniref:Uncharacterized protein n=1 Tax=Araneus ventricosus TaxID=182803 RepID=A0A4Y2TAB9_ARAVE|nr:hypothetical protein AVEN_271425-1 [Araneus ventricosus]
MSRNFNNPCVCFNGCQETQQNYEQCTIDYAAYYHPASLGSNLVKFRTNYTLKFKNPDSNFSLQQACHKFVMTRVQVCDKFVVTRVKACSKLTKAPKSP